MDMSWSAACIHKRAMDGYVGGMPASWSAVDVHDQTMDSNGRRQETEAAKDVGDRLQEVERALDEKEVQVKSLLGTLQELLALVKGQQGRPAQPSEWMSQREKDVISRAEQTLRQAPGWEGIGHSSAGLDPGRAPSLRQAAPGSEGVGHGSAGLDPGRAPSEVSLARPAGQPDSAVLEPSSEPGQPGKPNNGESGDILARCQALRQQWGTVKSDTIFSALQKLSGVTPDASSYAPGGNGRAEPFSHWSVSGRTDGGAGHAEPAKLQGAADPPRPWEYAGASEGVAGQICFGGYSAPMGGEGAPAQQGGHLRGASQLQGSVEPGVRRAAAAGTLSFATDRAGWPSSATDDGAAGTSPWAWARSTSSCAGQLRGVQASAAPVASPRLPRRAGLSF